MCLMQQPRYEAPPTVAPAPTRDEIAAQAADAKANPLNLAVEARRTASKRLSTFGNVKTTPMGDASYGSSTFAKFGKLPNAA